MPQLFHLKRQSPVAQRFGTPGRAQFRVDLEVLGYLSLFVAGEVLFIELNTSSDEIMDLKRQVGTRAAFEYPDRDRRHPVRVKHRRQEATLRHCYQSRLGPFRLCPSYGCQSLGLYEQGVVELIPFLANSVIVLGSGQLSSAGLLRLKQPLAVGFSFEQRLL